MPWRAASWRRESEVDEKPVEPVSLRDFDAERAAFDAERAAKKKQVADERAAVKKQVADQKAAESLRAEAAAKRGMKARRRVGNDAQKEQNFAKDSRDSTWYQCEIDKTKRSLWELIESADATTGR